MGVREREEEGAADILVIHAETERYGWYWIQRFKIIQSGTACQTSVATTAVSIESLCSGLEQNISREGTCWTRLQQGRHLRPGGPSSMALRS